MTTIIYSLLSIVLFLIILVSLSSAGAQAFDSRRISDLRQVSLALEMYYDGNSVFPAAEGETASDRWRNLGKPLENYLSSWPNDPRERQYDYKSSPDNKDYVLRAILDGCSNSALDTDIDGIIYGINCGNSQKRYSENQYCVGH